MSNQTNDPQVGDTILCCPHTDGLTGKTHWFTFSGGSVVVAVFDSQLNPIEDILANWIVVCEACFVSIPDCYEAVASHRSWTEQDVEDFTGIHNKAIV